MANVDPTKLSVFFKLFPELNQRQCRLTLLLTMGATIEDLSDLEKCTTSSIRKSLREAQLRLSISSQNCLRIVILSRVIFFLLNGIVPKLDME